ncbi:Copper resistance protein CopC [Methylocystis sp. SC2]|nr:copper resistance CopC family protein [Methylocystis sp. SC2]CCJ06572.1 Copper resistance protein CopC [Methylocystis sp. SC2]
MILRKELPFLLSLILAFALGRAPCLAHAALISASPQDGATVPSGDVVIQLRFNSRIDSKLSRLTLLKTAADQSVVQPLETSPVSEGLKARAPDLRSGAYTLEWQILSLDGHLTQGRLNFRVERR